MISKETFIKVSENSGVTTVKCIGIFNKKHAKLGDKVTVSIQKLNNAINNEKKTPFLKGQVLHGILVNLKRRQIRLNGFSFSFNENACVLIDQKGAPMFTRVSTVIPYEIRKMGYLKIFSLAKLII